MRSGRPGLAADAASAIAASTAALAFDSSTSLRPADGTWVDPDKIPARDELAVAIDALTAMTREAARREDPDQQLVNRVRTQARRLRDQ